VSQIGGQLMDWNSQSLGTIMRKAEATGKGCQVREALAVLIQHNLVSFGKNVRSQRPEYTIVTESCHNLMRYPKYLTLAKTLYGDEGEILVEELFSNGQDCASNAIYRAAKRLNPAEKASKTVPTVVKKLLMTFNEMVRCHFIQRTHSPYVNEKGASEEVPEVQPCPDLCAPEALTYFVPEVDAKAIITAVTKSEAAAAAAAAADNGEENGSPEVYQPKFADQKVEWRLNADRFLREFRDQIVVAAVTKRIDSSAGNMMRTLLTLMNETCPWAGTSAHLHQIDLSNRIDRAEPNSAVGCDKRLKKFHDQYLKVLEEDRTRFVIRVGDAGGGQYVVNCKHIFGELASAAADSIVLEKFGSKALRIFRVIRQKLHVEESQLQSYVMIPAKEIKLLTYQLMENNFIQLEELRKSMGGSANAPSKCFYLFCVDMNQVARMVVDMCYKAMANALAKKNHENSQNQRLLDKQEKIESICNNLKASAANSTAPESKEELQIQLQEINDMLSPAERESAKRVHERMDQLGRAVSQIDETLLVMLLYLRYSTST